MGEVRATVKLINAIGEGLVRRVQPNPAHPDQPVTKMK
jgi:hypothetical protein